MQRPLLTILFSLLVCSPAWAQRSAALEEALRDYLSFAGTDGSTAEGAYDELCHISENPININTASREELERLPFLTAGDVEAIAEYLYRHGPMKSAGELAMVGGLDWHRRRLLACLVYAGESGKGALPPLRGIARYGRHSAVVTGRIPCYSRAGDNGGYRGYQYKHSLRYDFSYGGDRLRCGLVGAQDAGEPFFGGVNAAGYDFYSFYLVARRLGRLKALAAGRYRLRFGMGLVVNNNRSWGKQAAAAAMRGGSITAHASASDADYMQGAAATVSMTEGVDVSAFVSHRRLDATLNADGSIAAVQTSGYHRTDAEISRKNNSEQTAFGANVSCRLGGFRIGATAAGIRLNRRLSPDTEAVYRRHHARGKRFANIGISYGYTGRRLSIGGETATDRDGAIATVNTATCGIGENIDVTLVQRFYSYRYHALMAESFSDGGSVQNESGVYLGASWRPLPALSITGYADVAYFAWPRYGAAGSSHSLDNLIQATCAQGCWTLHARYRMRMRERDNGGKDGLTYRRERRARLYAARKDDVWSMRTQIDMAHTDYLNSSFGWMISQSAGVNAGKRLYAAMSAAYFDTHDYNSRIYAYESGLRYAYSSPSFYGNGMRLTLMMEATLCNAVTLAAKVGTTKYFDRDRIGSGLQTINHSSATDVELQMRLKLERKEM